MIADPVLDPVLGLVLDGLIALLLLATIGYAVVLNRKLARLRAAKAELEALTARLVEATDKAQAGLEALKGHSRDSGERLQRTVEAARSLADELAFLVERGSGLARRLDGAIETARRAAGPGPGRNGARPQAAGAGAERGAGPARPAAPSPGQAKLLKVLQGMR